MKNDGVGRIHTLMLGVRLLLFFPLELFNKLLPLCCLAHPHHHQALVIPFRYHWRLGAENKGNLSRTVYIPAPLSINHTHNTLVWVREVVHSSMTPEKSGKVRKLPGLQKIACFISVADEIEWDRQGAWITLLLLELLPVHNDAGWGSMACLTVAGYFIWQTCSASTTLVHFVHQSSVYASSVTKANAVKKKIIKKTTRCVPKPDTRLF